MEHGSGTENAREKENHDGKEEGCYETQGKSRANGWRNKFSNNRGFSDDIAEEERRRL